MANMTFFNSGPEGISHPATGKTSTWDNFYRGIYPTRSTPGTTNGGYVERTPSPGPSSPYMTAAERAEWDRLYRNPVPTGAPPTQVASVPMPRPRPGNAPTILDIAAMNGMPAPPWMPTATPAVAAEMATTPPAQGGGQLGALLDAVKGLGWLINGGAAAKPKPAPRPKVAANALIDGQRGKDNMPGANYMGRSVGTDGKVRAYNQDTKSWDNLSQNSKPSPSQSYKKDSMGDRDMRQSSKQKYDY
jgi:hypothetical protein